MNFEQIKDKATIICGHPKSGTTLLLSLLDSHPQLTVFPEELGFFRAVYGKDNCAEQLLTKSGIRLLQLSKIRDKRTPELNIRDYSDIDFENIEKSVRSLCSKTTDFKEILTGSIGVWHTIQASKSHEKVRWVEKTPHNEKCVPIYNQWFKENAVYFHIIRDPRDNIATYHKKHSYFAVKHLALGWALSYKIGEWAKQHVPNYHFIKYEDLVTDPEQELRKICHILGIQYSETLLYPTKNGKPWNGNSMYNTSFTKISSRSVGRYKEQLDEKTIEYLEITLQDFMNNLGYTYDRSLPRKPSAVFVRKLRREFLKWQLFISIYQYPGIYNRLIFLVRFAKNLGIYKGSYYKRSS